MKVEYKKLKSAVDSANLEDGEIVSYKGLDNYLIFCDEDCGLPAEYRFPSQLVDGADIYLWSSIRDEFKRPMLLHEILEFTYLHERFGQLLETPDFIPESESQKEWNNAHNLARKYDERYARETLDESTFVEYLAYREKINGFFGS